MIENKPIPTNLYCLQKYTNTLFFHFLKCCSALFVIKECATNTITTNYLTKCCEDRRQEYRSKPMISRNTTRCVINFKWNISCSMSEMCIFRTLTQCNFSINKMLRERKMEQKETSKSEDSFASPRTTIKRKKSAAERIGIKGKH